MRRVGIVAVLIAIPAAAAAQSAGQWRGPEQIWAATCGYCHDEGVGPELRGRKLPAMGIAPVVRQGLPGMPSFHPSEMNDRELDALARWIERGPAPAEAAGK